MKKIADWIKNGNYFTFVESFVVKNVSLVLNKTKWNIRVKTIADKERKGFLKL